MLKFSSSCVTFHISSSTMEKSTTSPAPGAMRSSPAALRSSAMSRAMMPWMPSRCTLTTTRSPSISRAVCACAMDAEPMGVRLNSEYTSSMARPRELSTTRRTSSKGMGGTAVRSCVSASQYSLGIMSERMDMICPSLI